MGDVFTLADGTTYEVHARITDPAPVARTATIDPFRKYSPDQPRDNNGRFADIAGTVAARTLIDDGDTSSYHGKAITSGKAVSPYPERSQQVHALATDRPSRRAAITSAVRDFRSKNRSLLSQPGHALGTWYDTSTHTLWLDVVVVVKTSEEAATLARQHNQIAYFDLDTGTEVHTGGTGLVKRIARWFQGPRGLEGRGDGRGDRGSDPRLDPFDFGFSLGVEKRFNPDQPRDDWGRWSETGRLSPGNEPEASTPSGRGGAPDNPDATRTSSMPDAFRKAQLKKLASVHLTPEKLADNLDAIMQRAIKEYPEIVKLGKSWYSDANARIAEHAAESGFPVDTAIGMTAAMSPQNEWGQNIAMAGEMMRQLKADGFVNMNAEERAWLKDMATPPAGWKSRPSHLAAQALLDTIGSDGRGPRLSSLPADQAAWAVMRKGKSRQLISENMTPKGEFALVSHSTGNSGMTKAIRIGRGEDIDTVLGGHKVRSFYNNLSDPNDSGGFGDVTIDTHAASAAQHFRMPMTSVRLDRTFSAGSSRASNQAGLYPIYADAFREVAHRHHMTPNQAQAVLWVTWQQVRHEYPGITVSERAGQKAQDVVGAARASTIGRYGVQVGHRDGETPRYRSQVSHWKQYQDGLIDYATYAALVGRTVD